MAVSKKKTLQGVRELRQLEAPSTRYAARSLHPATMGQQEKRWGRMRVLKGALPYRRRRHIPVDVASPSDLLNGVEVLEALWPRRQPR